MCAVVVQDQVHIKVIGYRSLDSIEELTEFDRAVTLVALANHFAGPGQEKGAPLRLAWAQGNSGRVRSSAWRVFSSTHMTNALSGGSR